MKNFHKTLLFVLVFICACFIFSAKAKSAQAITYHSSTFRNDGSITVNVTYYIMGNTQGAAQQVTFSDGQTTRSVTVPPGSQVNDQPTEGPWNPNYRMTWWSNCIDPNVNAIAQTPLSQGNFVAAYGNINVSPSTPCGEPVITSINCPAPGTSLTFNWSMTGGNGQYNVANYQLFRSQSPDTDPNDNWIEQQTTTASSSSKTWTGMANTTYYVRVSAVPPTPPAGSQPMGWSAPYYASVTCALSTTSPPTALLNANVPSCSSSSTYGGTSNQGNWPGNTTNVINAFNVAAGVTQAQYYLYENGNPVVYLEWTGLVGPTQPYVKLWNLNRTSSYTWKVRALNGGGWSDWSNGPVFGPVLSCYVAPGAPINLSESKPSCADSPFSVTFNWGYGAGPITQVDFKLINKDTLGTINSATWYSSFPTSRVVSSIPILPYTRSYEWQIKTYNGTGSNMAYREFTIPACSIPDLIISSITTNKASYSLGESITATITYKNNGTGAVINNNNNLASGMSGNTNINTWSQCNNFVGGDTQTVFSFSNGNMSAGATAQVTRVLTAPSFAGTFLIRVVIDPMCLVTEAGDINPALAANNIKDLPVVVNAPVNNPSNLLATATCSQNGNQPIITFSWTSPTNEDGLWIDINKESFYPGTTDTDGWSFKAINNNSQTSYDWSVILTPSQTAGLMDSGSIIDPTRGSRYYWRLKSYNSVSEGTHIYPGGTDGVDADTIPDGLSSAPTATGGSFVTLLCTSDLRFDPVYGISVPSSGLAGSVQNVTYVVRNIGTGYSVVAGTNTDYDGDGFSNNVEDYIGTDKHSRCGPNAWPLDLNSDGNLNGFDWITLTAMPLNFGAYSGEANYVQRYDLNADGRIWYEDDIAHQGVVMTGSLPFTRCNQPVYVALNYTSDNLNVFSCNSGGEIGQYIDIVGPGSTSPTYTQPVIFSNNVTDQNGQLIQHKIVGFVNYRCFFPEQVIDNIGWGTYTVYGSDLSITSFVPNPPIVNCPPSCNFQAGVTVTATVTVKNNSGSGPSSPTTLGVWPGYDGETLPTCSDSNGTGASTPPNSYAVPSIAVGASSPPISVSFNVGSVTGSNSAYAYVIPECNLVDTNWTNNQSIAFGYEVRLDSWFETVHGDVGSLGNINVGINSGAFTTPLSPRYQSNYLLVRNSTGNNNANTSGWYLKNYNKPLTAANNVYNYLSDRFLEKAKATNTMSQTNGECNIPAGNASGLIYCGGNARFNAGGFKKGGVMVYFIEGSLFINNDLEEQNQVTDSVVFVVRNDIIVNTTVTKLNGIYIAGGTFRDTTDSTNITGNQLVVSGSILAGTVDLARKLAPSGSTCAYPTSHSCLNSTDPAEVVKFDPKYLNSMNLLLASPEITWQEVSP